MRLCSRCEERPRRPGQRWCKECHSAYVRDHRDANRKRRLEDEAVGAQDCGPLSGIYFIQCGAFVKIGVSANVGARLSQIRASNPHAVAPLGFVPEPIFGKADDLERQMHERFAQYRHRGEWFVASAEILRFVEEKSKAWPIAGD